jgi:FixJ family two-component response regulator
MGAPSGSDVGRAGDSAATPVVYVVDDDVSVRESLELLICTAGWRPQLFGSAQEFISQSRPLVPSCLLLDLHLPDLSGLDLQSRVAHDRTSMPIIFISGFGDVPSTVRAMKAGAVEFLTKPFDEAVLLDAIRDAIARSTATLRDEQVMHALKTRYSSLTPREHDVMSLVVLGLLNKQVADRLGISEVTVKAHRGSLMRKMNARSLPDLVNISARLLDRHPIV